MPAPVHHPPSTFRRSIGLALAAAAAVCVVLLAFAWPAITSDPHDIPVGIVGQGPQREQLVDGIARQSDGALKLTDYGSRDEAVAAIERREAYGAIVLPAGEGAAPEVLIATAANSAVAQMLTGMATQLQNQLTAQVNDGVEAQVRGMLAGGGAGQAPPAAGSGEFTIPRVAVAVTDVAPFSAEDPRGAGLSAAALPLVMGGMIGAMIISSAIHGSRRRFVALVVYTLVAGFALSGILEGWFGALHGGYWANVLAITLSIGAISATIVGLRSVFGFAGLGVGVVTMFFFANPISGSAMPPEFLVGPWGAIGQWFPPGAGQTLIRELSYFPAANTTFPWLVLSGWALFGLVLLWIGSMRKVAYAPAPGSQPDEAEGRAEVAAG